MTRRLILAAAVSLLLAGCFRPGAPTAGPDPIQTGFRAWVLMERELMLVDERLQMQALDGTLSGGDAGAQLKDAAQRLLAQPISRVGVDGIVHNHQVAADAFFAYVDAAIARTSDPAWRALAAGRMGEIRADDADAINRGLDPSASLSSAYEMLARARGVQGPVVSPFDNARADADQTLPASPSLPQPATAQPVTPIPPG